MTRGSFESSSAHLPAAFVLQAMFVQADMQLRRRPPPDVQSGTLISEGPGKLCSLPRVPPYKTQVGKGKPGGKAGVLVGPRGHADQKSLIWAAHLLQEVLQDPQIGVLTSCSLHSRSASQAYLASWLRPQTVIPLLSRLVLVPHGTSRQAWRDDKKIWERDTLHKVSRPHHLGDCQAPWARHAGARFSRGL